METKTYRVRTMNEAIDLIREQLGPTASILHSRRMAGAWRGWIPRARRWEVVASIDADVPCRLPKHPRAAMDSELVGRHVTELSDEPTNNQGERCGGAESANTIRLVGGFDIPSTEQSTIAFVGPTGVGKTTTLAKIAARLQFEDGKRIGLITVDTFRIGAVEQLRTYARILGVPMEVVSTAAQMRQACDLLSDRDVILIDTHGCGPGDRERLEELRRILVAADVNEVMQVISAVHQSGSVAREVGAYRQLAARSLVISKVDESTTLDHLAQCLATTQLPIRYCTNGQNVPADLLEATVEHVERLFHQPPANLVASAKPNSATLRPSPMACVDELDRAEVSHA